MELTIEKANELMPSYIVIATREEIIEEQKTWIEDNCKHKDFSNYAYWAIGDDGASEGFHSLDDIINKFGD